MRSRGASYDSLALVGRDLAGFEPPPFDQGKFCSQHNVVLPQSPRHQQAPSADMLIEEDNDPPPTAPAAPETPPPRTDSVDRAQLTQPN